MRSISCLGAVGASLLTLLLAACGGGGGDPADTLAPVTLAAPPGGTYQGAQTVTLTCDDGQGSGCLGTYYTTDGSTPDQSSWLYATPIPISADTTLKFFSVDEAGNAESVRTESYVIDPVVQDTVPPVTSAAPPGGSYTAAQSVVLTCDDGAGSGCAATHYTLDGSIPTTASAVYAAPLEIAADTQLRFFSVDQAGNQEAVKSEAYAIDIQQDTTPPVTLASPAGGTYAEAQSVALTCQDGAGSGCQATHYTLDGSIPTVASPVYAAPLQIAADTTLRFFSVDVAGNQEVARSETYAIDIQQNTPPVADAGPDQTVAVGAAVSLDGEGSADADGDPLTYAWAMVLAPAGFSNVLDDPTSPTPSFVADVAGEYRLRLTVHDGQAASDPDEVVITAGAVPQLVAMYPAWGTPIGRDMPISLTFDQSMDPGLAVISGDLGLPDAWQATWNSVTVPNDQLVLSPSPDWNVGFERTLHLDVHSALGVPLHQAIPYDVLDAAGVTYLFVNGQTGDDANDGLLPWAPKQTLRNAVEAATPPAAVLIAGGDYLVSSDPATATHVVLRSGVSLFGGYASEFTLRDPVQHLTRIVDQSTALLVGNAAVMAQNGATIGPDTVLHGLSIRGGGGTQCTGVQLDNASPTLRHLGVRGGTCEYSYGVLLSNGSAPWIVDCRIHGGEGSQNSTAVEATNSRMLLERSEILGGTGGTFSYGVLANSSLGDVVRNNLVRGGSGGTFSFGVHLEGPVQLLNNTIDGGTGPVYSVAVGYTAGPTELANNVVFTSGGNTRLCLWEDQGVSNPAALLNNDLFDCPTALYVDFVPAGGTCPFWGNGNCLTDVAAVNALADMSTGASGNVSLDPGFVDPTADWHLTPASPAEVREGGLDLSDEFPPGLADDFDGLLRSVPWSMGAFEQD